MVFSCMLDTGRLTLGHFDKVLEMLRERFLKCQQSGIFYTATGRATCNPPHRKLHPANTGMPKNVGSTLPAGTQLPGARWNKAAAPLTQQQERRASRGKRTSASVLGESRRTPRSTPRPWQVLWRSKHTCDDKHRDCSVRILTWGPALSYHTPLMHTQSKIWQTFC